MCVCSSAQAPKVMKIFINLPRSMGFDDAERSEATQTLELSEEDYKDDGLIPLRYVKFQNVQSVTVRRRSVHDLLLELPVGLGKSSLISLFLVQLFVKSSLGDEETTKINYLTFIGTPVQATNMNDFKRVNSWFQSVQLEFSPVPRLTPSFSPPAGRWEER